MLFLEKLSLGFGDLLQWICFSDQRLDFAIFNILNQIAKYGFVPGSGADKPDILEI